MPDKKVPIVLLPFVVVGSILKVTWDALTGAWSRRNEDKE